MAPASSSPPPPPPKLNNFAVAGSTAKPSPPASTPTPKLATVLAPSPPSSLPESAVQQPPAAPSKPAPLPSSPPRPSVVAPSKATDVPATTTTTKDKKVHTTTKAVEVQEGKQQPIEAPAAVTLGSLPPTTLSVVGPSTLTNLKGAPTLSQKPSTPSVVVALSTASARRSTGPSQPVPSLVAGGGNNAPLASTSIIGASSDRNNTKPHVNGTPTSTILAISVVGVLVVLGIVGFVVRRRLKNEERLVLGSGGRGGDGGGVSRGWKTLDEDGQGQFADDLKTEKGFSSGGGGQEMAMNDGASFVWGGQGYRGADVEEQERQEQEQAYWRQQQEQQGYQETARVSSFYPPTPPKLYAAQMAPPPTRPPRPDDGNGHRTPYGQHPPAPSGVRNLYAPHSSSAPAHQPPPPRSNIPQRTASSSQRNGGPSCSAATSLHPSHAVTHHPPIRTRSKTAANGAGGGRDLLKKNVGEMNARTAREEQQEHLQEGDRTSRGNFGSLMMMEYDEEGAMSPLPTHPLSPTFLPYHQDRANNSGGADENGFVPLSQMAFERKEPKYRSPIESIFETYEGEDTTAADSRTSYAGSYVYT